MPVEASVSVVIADAYECAFARLTGNPRVLFQISIISEKLDRKFDEYRLPVMFIDGVKALDLCSTKAFDELSSDLTPDDHLPGFDFEPQCIIGQVWHGLVNEGTGLIGQVLKASSILIRLYFDDYDVVDIAMDEAALSSLKSGIKTNILRL